jgi:hypothetical protein
MIQTKILLTTALMVLIISSQTSGQFDSGSDGSFGPINVAGANMTIPLPPDGIIHATTIDIENNRTLNFTRNEFNTPAYLLATGDVTIDGKISINGSFGTETAGGAPGPGGFYGGNPGTVGSDPGDGYGPGGGKSGAYTIAADGAGSGGYATVATWSDSAGQGEVYGSPVLIPLVGGSGGGGAEGTPGLGGSGGGGALLLASNTQIEFKSTAVIHANGGRISNGIVTAGGSGGAVRFVAPKVFGSGIIQTESTNENWSLSFDRFGGYGRIRIDTLDRTGLSFSFRPPASASIGANMVVFPAITPRLDLTEVAGEIVTLDAQNAVLVDLPFDADPNRTVTIRAQDFDKVVNIAVVLQPDNGERIVYEDTIDNSAANPATKVVNVVFPTNTQTQVFVWTRPDA